MIKGRKKEQKKEIIRFPTAEELYDCTNGGYDIFKRYLGKIGKVMDRPWGKRESHPSWGIFMNPSNGYWYWKDHATEESGTALQFVERYFNLSHGDAKDMIVKDFCTGNVGQMTPVRPPEAIERDYVDIKFSDQSFKERHHAFWNIAEVTEEDLRKLNYFAVKDLAINGKRVPISDKESVFAYLCEEEDAAKIYFADRPKGKKFKMNVSGKHLWHFDDIDYCDDMIIQKSNKDLAVTKMIFKDVICTPNESVSIFDDSTVSRINRKSSNPIIFYGSDEDGMTKSRKICELTGWNRIYTPEEFLPDVNDVYSFVRMHNLIRMGTGLKELEKLIRI